MSRIRKVRLQPILLQANGYVLMPVSLKGLINLNRTPYILNGVYEEAVTVIVFFRKFQFKKKLELTYIRESYSALHKSWAPGRHGDHILHGGA